jgi:diguanylate cyclase (GGDEF)-like protein/PAS domain S-box-containing protein
MELASHRSALTSLEHATQAGTWVVHLQDPPVLWWSDGTRALLEWPPEAPIPTLEGALAVYTEPSRQRVAAALGHSRESGEAFDLELEMLTARGRPLFVRVTGEAEREGGAVRRLSGTIQNIDRQRQAESRASQLREHLAEFEERWRMATEGSGLGVWDWDVPTNTVYYSPQWKQMLGYAEHEIGEHAEESISRLHPDDAEAVLADLHAHLEGRSARYRSEHRVRCKDGRYRWFLDRGQITRRSDDGKPLRVVGTFADISRRKFLEDVAEQASARYRAVFQSAHHYIGLLSPDGVLLDVNQVALDFAGLQPDAVIGRPFWDCHWWQTGEETQARLRAAVARAAGGETVRYQVRARGVGEQTAVIDFTLKPMLDERGEVMMIVPEGHDITLQAEAEERLQASERLFRATFDDAPIGTAIVGLDGRWLEVNAALCEMLGYSAGELRQRSFQDITHPDDLAPDLAEVDRLLAGERHHYQIEKRYLHAQGHVVIARLDVTLVRDDARTPLFFLSQIQDITAASRVRDALQQERELAQTTLSAISDAVIRTDPLGQVTYANEAAMSLLRVVGDELIGRPFERVVRLVGEREGELASSPAGIVLQEGRDLRQAVHGTLQRRDGSRVAVEYTAAPIRSGERRLLGSVVVLSDVSVAHELAGQLRYQATHDSLTGLRNRRAFEEALEQALAAQAAGGPGGQLLLMDLDHFKTINDRCGHAAGDQVLQALTERMKARLRRDDVLARLGGDEFALILPDCRRADAERMARQLVELVAAYRFDWHGQSYGLGLSVGLAGFDHAGSCEQLLRQADQACYEAKRQGRGQVQAAPTLRLSHLPG